MNRGAWIVIVSLMLTCLPAASQPPPPPMRLPADLTSNRLLFLRHDRLEGGEDTDTLVVATLRPDGFELRDLYSHNNLNVGLDPLGVFGGKAYLVQVGRVLCVDLATGLCTLIAPDVRSYAHADGKLFRADRGRICEYDLRLQAWRQITTVTNWPDGTDIGLSADGRWLAFFARRESPDAPSRHQLTVVDLEKRTVREIGKPVRYVPRPTSSLLGGGPPFAWLDEQRLLFVRSDIPQERKTPDGVVWTGDGVNRVALADLRTGQVRDVATLPGSAYHSGFITFSPVGPGQAATLDIAPASAPGSGRYVIDVEAGELVESDSIGGDFRLRQREERQELRHGERLLAETDGRIQAAVSPDLEQVAWTGAPRGRLCFYHEDDAFVRTVAEGWLGDCLLWFGEDGLRPPSRPPRLAAEWRPFEHSPYPRPRQPDTREDISDYVGFTISCDKQTYRLHEPVLLTLTIANKGNLDLTVARPRLDWTVAAVAMDWPGGGKSLDKDEWGGEEINPIERVVLKPGASVSAVAIVEVSQPGAYSIRAEYNERQISAARRVDFRGRLTADPVELAVLATPANAELLKTKMDRLLTALRAQQARGPQWDGWLPAVDDIAEVGREAGPYLLAALEQEQDARIIRRLYRSLNLIVSADALPAYREALTSEDTKVQKLAVAGLYELCAAETVVKQEALEALLRVVSSEFPKDLRAEAARHLVRIHDPVVRATFERLVAGGDADITPKAARYLAAWEDMDLADWLAAVRQTPTQTRVAAARVVIADLRRTWHLERMGDLAGFTWEGISGDAAQLAAFRGVVSSWVEWAQEHGRVSEAYFAADRKHWTR